MAEQSQSKDSAHEGGHGIGRYALIWGILLFFMHMWDMGGVNRVVFLVSVLFAAVLILGVFGDLMVRIPVSLPHGGPQPALSHPPAE